MRILPKVSLIMPSLNVAPYYIKCMESAIGQSLRDLEIIAVDAGSEDGTLDILRKYAESDSRITVIHSDKKSYGAQMNLGIEAARGEYVAFLETDDYLCPYAMERLYDIAKADSLDYIKGWTYSFWEDEEGSRNVLEDDKTFFVLPMGEEVFSPKEYPKLLILDFHVWNGLYKRTFLEKIKFNETKGAAFQDIGFIVQYIMRAEAARYIDLPVYWYRRSNEKSSVFSQSGFKYLADEFEKIVETNKIITDKQWQFLWYRLMMQLITRFETMYKCGEIWQGMENDLDRVYRLLKIGETNGQLNCIYNDVIYGKLLNLMLNRQYETLKTIDWLYEPVREVLECFDEDNVFIYGAGRRGCRIRDTVLKLGKKPPTAFVDSNPNMWGKVIAGTVVMSLEEAMEKKPKAKYLIAVKNYEQEVKEKLLSAGVNRQNIICFNALAGMWGYNIGRYMKNVTWVFN